MVNGHSLAHVSRPLQIVRILRMRGHEVLFAGGGKYLQVAADEGYPVFDLPYISTEQMNEAIRHNKLGQLYSEKQMSEFIQAEMELYQRIQPNLVMVDCRITATTSAEIMGLKTVGITNVHMCLYRQIPFFSLRNSILGSLEPLMNLTDKIENSIEFSFWERLVVKNLNLLRKIRGLAKKYAYEIDEGDLCLLADVPEFSPVRSLPDHVKCVGPLPWRNQLPAPKCLNQLDPGKKLIFLNLGSEGLENLLENLKIFPESETQVLVATGEAKLSPNLTVPKNIFLEKYVNLDTILPYCDLVACHGGNGTVYQALSYGVPIVGIACHEEQNYNLKRLSHLKLGIGMTQEKIKKQGLGIFMKACFEVLTQDQYKRNAKDFQNILEKYDGPKLGAELIEKFFLNLKQNSKTSELKDSQNNLTIL